MSNRPFSSSSSDRDGSSEYDFDFGQDINPAPLGQPAGQQQPSGYPGFPTSPQRNIRRNCIVLFSFFFVCVCACCVFLGTLMALQREETLVMLWLDWISPSGQSPITMNDVVTNVEQAEDVGLLCAGSQATDFTQRFFERYEDQDVSITDYRLSGNDGEIQVTGDWRLDDGEEQEYEAVFILDTSLTGYLGVMGCIEEIRQISPPFEPASTDAIFGG